MNSPKPNGGLFQRDFTAWKYASHWPKITSFRKFSSWLNLFLHESKLSNLVFLLLLASSYLTIWRLPWNHRLLWTEYSNWMEGFLKKKFFNYFRGHCSESGMNHSHVYSVPLLKWQRLKISHSVTFIWTLGIMLPTEAHWGKVEGGLFHQRKCGTLAYLGDFSKARIPFYFFPLFFILIFIVNISDYNSYNHWRQFWKYQLWIRFKLSHDL